MTGSMLLPLLHVASEPASAAAAVDLRLVAAVAALGGFAGGAVFGRATWGRSPVLRLASIRAQRFAAAFVLLFAVLPNVAAWEHVLQSGGSDAGAEVHAAHCHESAATCSDLPILSGPGQLLYFDPLLTDPVLAERPISVQEVLLVGRSSSPDVPPPRAA